MDIQKVVSEDQERGWDFMSSMEYEVQEKSVDGMQWWSLGKYETLDQATDRKMEYLRRWFPDREREISDSEAGVRIIARSIVEVIL